MDLNALQIFARVVEQGGFTAAARVLDSNKATVSRKVADLEQQLGVRLLTRNTRRIELTEAGQLLYQRARGAIQTLQEAELELSREQRELSGTLRLVMPIELGQLAAGRWIGEFMQRHPKLSVFTELSNRQVDLVGEGVDLALRVGLGDDSSLVARRLIGNRSVLVASAAYVQRHGQPTHPDELSQHRLLAIKAPLVPDSWPLVKDKERVDYRPGGQLQSNNITFLREAALAGAGIVLLPEGLIADAIERGEAVRILPGWTTEDTGIYALYPGRRLVPAKVTALLDFILEKINEYQPTPESAIQWRPDMAVRYGDSD